MKTITKEVLDRLRWHAGMTAFSEDDLSLASLSWAPEGRSEAIARATTDVLDVLASVNRWLNGDKPSESMDKASSVPRDVVYAVETIRRMLKDGVRRTTSESDRLILLTSEERVAFCWDAIMAGDIDDLIEFVDREMEARQ